MSSYCDTLKHESGGTSCELKAWKHEFKPKSTSSDPRITSSNWQVQDYEMLVRIHDLKFECRITGSEFKFTS